MSPRRRGSLDSANADHLEQVVDRLRASRGGAL